MALEMAPGIIHLKEAATGRTVARLEDPHGDRATWQAFTPDGTRGSGRVRLRQRDPHLGPAGDPRAAEGDEAGLGLARGFRPAETGGPAAEPVTIEGSLPATWSSSRRFERLRK